MKNMSLVISDPFPTDVERLEKVRIYMQGVHSDFVIIFKPISRLLPFKLKWRAGAGRNGASREDIDKIATTYIKVATYCYLRKQTLALSESFPGPTSKIRRWRGLSYAVGDDKIPGPTNSIGQRWWLLAIGGGPLRQAGYVLVARVPAVSRMEVDNHAAVIGTLIKE
jgi:hypothetical protein